MRINIYKGDEAWVLSGIASQLQVELQLLDVETQIITATSQGFVFTSNKDIDFHLFASQGLLRAYAERVKDKDLSKCLSLCTHYDPNTYDLELLNKCRLLIFQSSLQMAAAIANGLNRRICHHINYGVDNNMHQIHSNSNKINHVARLLGSTWPKHIRRIVGFCGRYRNKGTYPLRKNYGLISDLVNELISKEIPVICLGDNWDKLFPKSVLNSDWLRTVSTEYANYPIFYNLMSLLISPSIYEAGPIPVLEAMSCGVYPVATRTGFIPDIITSHYIGKSIPIFSNVSDYMREIEVSIYNISKIQRLELREVSSMYSYKILAHKITKLLEQS